MMTLGGGAALVLACAVNAPERLGHCWRNRWCAIEFKGVQEPEMYCPMQLRQIYRNQQQSLSVLSHKLQDSQFM